MSKKIVKTDPCFGYALRVGGPHPYIYSVFVPSDEPQAEQRVRDQCSEPYHKVVPAVVLSLADYRRLTRRPPRPAKVR